MTLVGMAARKLSIKRRNAKLAAAFPNGVRCQKCLEHGHWSYECKEKRKFVHRSSRTKQLNKRIAEKTAAENDAAAAAAAAVAVHSNLAVPSTKHGKSKAKRFKHANSSSGGNSSSGSSDTSDSSASDSSDSDSDDTSDSSSNSSDSSSDSSGSDSDSSGSSDGGDSSSSSSDDD